MSEPLLVRAARREEVERTPVWFMRQAGRSLPEYRAIRAKHAFFEVAHTPELCAEVTLQPVRRHDVDAAVMFADIMTPVIGMGVDVQLVENVGPVIDRPIESLDDRITVLGSEPDVLTVELDALKTRTVPVVVERGTVPDGLEVGETTVDPSEVEVSGPSSVIERVVAARADVAIQPGGMIASPLSVIWRAAFRCGLPWNSIRPARSERWNRHWNWLLRLAARERSGSMSTCCT